MTDKERKELRDLRKIPMQKRTREQEARLRALSDASRVVTARRA